MTIPFITKCNDFKIKIAKESLRRIAVRKISYMALVLFCMGFIVSGCFTAAQPNKQATDHTENKNNINHNKRASEPDVGLKYHFSQALKFDKELTLKSNTRKWIWNSLLLMYDDKEYRSQGDMALKQKAREKISFWSDVVDETLKKDAYVAVSNTIKDSTAGLEWYINPHSIDSPGTSNIMDIGRGMNFIATRVWVELLAVESGGWRLPTKIEAERFCFLMNELQRQDRNTHILSGRSIWTSEVKDSIFSWRVDFGNNCKGNWWICYDTRWTSAVAVRVLE